MFDYEREREEALYFESIPFNPGAEAEREARMFGFKRPDDEWLLTAYDTWVHNPYYDGPRGIHPEDDR